VCIVTESFTPKYTHILALADYHSVVINIVYLCFESLGCVNATALRPHSFPSCKFCDSISESVMPTSFHIVSNSSLRIRRYLIRILESAALCNSGFSQIQKKPKLRVYFRNYKLQTLHNKTKDYVNSVHIPRICHTLHRHIFLSPLKHSTPTKCTTL
jgi:hypothetical protein